MSDVPPIVTASRGILPRRINLLPPSGNRVEQPVTQDGLIINKLIAGGLTTTAKLEALLSKAVVQDGDLVLQTDKSPIKLSIFSINGNEFVKADINLPKTLSPTESFEGNPPLMYRYPFVVLKPNSRYGIYLEVPETLFSKDWETFRPDFMHTGERKEGLCSSLLVDGENPLARQPSNSGSFNEILFGIRPDSERRPDDEPLPVPHGEDTRGLFISKRSTLVKPPDELIEAIRRASGESTPATFDNEDLIFTVPEAGSIRGDIFDEQGCITAYVLSVEHHRNIRQIELQPRASDSFMMGGGLKSAGGFSAGHTSFGPSRREEGNLSGIKPLGIAAAFGIVLVSKND